MFARVNATLKTLILVKRSRGIGFNWSHFLSKRQILPLWHFFFVFCFLEMEIEMSLEEKRRGKEDHKNRKKILLHKKRKEEKG